METVRFTKVLRQDFDVGQSQREVTLADGRVVTMDQVDLWHGLIYLHEYSNLSDAQSAAAGKGLLITRQVSLSTTTTFSADVPLYFWGNGGFVVSSGATITIKGPIIAPSKLLFTGAGTVLVENGGPIEVAWYVTGGTGTSASPYTGWPTLPWRSGQRYHFFDVATYATTATWTIAALHNVMLLGGGGNVPNLTGTKIVWNGTNGGNLFVLDRCRDCTIEGFTFGPGTGTVGVMIDIDHLVAPGSTLSSHNRFRRVNIDACTTGVRIGNLSTANNELHIFEDVLIEGSGTNGYLISNGQAKFIKLISGTVATRTVGINCAAGSFRAMGTNFSHNTTDILLGAPTDTIVLEFCQSEGAAKLLDDGGTGGSAWAVTIMGCRASPLSVGGDNLYVRYRKRGPLVLIGNDFADGVNSPNTQLYFQVSDPGASVTAHGNIFPNATPFFTTSATTETAGGTAIRHAGNVYVDGSGNGQSLDIATPAQLTADQNNYNPSHALTWRLSSDATRTITGIGAPWSGRILTIINVGSFNITLGNLHAGSIDHQQIRTGQGADVTLLPDDTADLVYDGTTLKWRVKNVY